jgi:hypothetical protein
MGLVAAGVGGIKLQGRDEVAGMEVLHPQDEILFVTSDGRAKRVAVEQFPVQGRNGMGVVAWKLPRAAQIVGIATGKGTTRITLQLEKLAPKSLRLDEAPLQNRTASGKQVVDLKAGDRLLALTVPWENPGERKIARPRPQTNGDQEEDELEQAFTGEATQVSFEELLSEKTPPALKPQPAVVEKKVEKKSVVKPAPVKAEQPELVKIRTEKPAPAAAKAPARPAKKAEQKKTARAKAAKTPAAKTTGTKTPAAKTTLVKKTTVKKLEVKTPAAKAPAEKAKPAARKTSGAAKPMAKTPAAKTATAKKPAAKAPAKKTAKAAVDSKVKTPAKKSTTKKTTTAKVPAGKSKAAVKKPAATNKGSPETKTTSRAKTPTRRRADG